MNKMLHSAFWVDIIAHFFPTKYGKNIVSDSTLIYYLCLSSTSDNYIFLTINHFRASKVQYMTKKKDQF